MALSLKDPETDRLAREVATLTGESLTEAVRTALEHNPAVQSAAHTVAAQRARNVHVHEGVDEDAFVALREKRATNQPRRRIVLETGTTLHSMGGSYGKYLGTKFYSTNPKHGSHFFFFLFDAETATPLAQFEANWLGQIRTGAASGLATRRLALPGPVTVAVGAFVLNIVLSLLLMQTELNYRGLALYEIQKPDSLAKAREELGRFLRELPKNPLAPKARFYEALCLVGATLALFVVIPANAVQDLPGVISVFAGVFGLICLALTRQRVEQLDALQALLDAQRSTWA